MARLGPAQKMAQQRWGKEPHILAAQIEQDLRATAAKSVRDAGFWVEALQQIEETLDIIPKERVERDAVVMLARRWELQGASRKKLIAFLTTDQQKTMAMLREYWHLRSDQDVATVLLQTALNAVLDLLGGHVEGELTSSASASR